MKSHYLTLLALLTWFSAQSQSEIITFKDGIRFKNAPLEKSFDSVYFKLRDNALKLSATNLKVSFGMNGNTNASNSLFVVNSGIQASHLFYKDEFSFDSKFNIQSKNGVIQQNVSTFNFSYDHFMNDLTKKFNWEGFAFLNRTNNSFMSVNQRYEIGGGFILQNWSQSKVQKKKSLQYLQVQDLKIKEDTILIFCRDNCSCNEIEVEVSDKIEKSKIDAFNSAKNRILQTEIKKNSDLRYGLLLGTFYEIEQILFNDSIHTINGKRDTSVNFDATNKWRWELRPTVDFTIETAKFKIRPYLKLPMPWEWTRSVEGKDVVDFRFEMPLSFNLKISEQFSTEVSYTLYYDNAPNSATTNYLNTNGEQLYVTADKLNELINFSVVYQLK